MSLSFGSIVPRPVPDAVTEQTLANLAVPVARRLAFVRVLSAFGAALVLTAVILAATGYPGRSPGAAGAFGTLLGFGIAALVAAGITALAFNARKTLIRRKFIYPAKTPETVADAWIGVGIMAAITLVILVLAAIFGGADWSDKAHNIVQLLPLALLGPGIVAGMFLITGYTMARQDAIFQRWLAKRPLAAAEYAGLLGQLQRTTPGTNGPANDASGSHPGH
ncbi:MAG: hypothetical protein WBX27_09425 [Specibacter sp.]